MDTTLPAALWAPALGALVVSLVVLGVVLVRMRRSAALEVAAARAETTRLAEQVALLADRVGRLQQPEPVAREAAYVITDAGSPDLEPRPMVRDTIVLNAALGEPLVKAVALGHGVRRALSPQARARIRVAVRQETRRARKQRRREMREVWLAHKRASRAAAAAPTSSAADAA